MYLTNITSANGDYNLVGDILWQRNVERCLKIGQSEKSTVE